MQNNRRPLSDRLAVFPRLGLANLPTPLEPMKRLTAHLGGPRLWVKREDATGLGFGGNKLRKLDYVLHEAVTSGADVLVSGGVVQSNSQRQVAAAAAKLGLACHLAVYHGRLAPPMPEYKTSGNAFLNRLFGAQLHDVPWTGDRNAAIRTLVDDLQAKGHKPYFVPYGVSNALGAVAYATTIAEIEAQAAQSGFAPAAIVHCTGSAGTQAGHADRRDRYRRRTRAGARRCRDVRARSLRPARRALRRSQRGSRCRPRGPCLRRPARSHHRSHPPRRPARSTSARSGLFRQ